MADKTDKRLTRDLMLEAVPNSSANILDCLAICVFRESIALFWRLVNLPDPLVG